MKFFNKKAQQLSMNFLVKFIIGVVLFSMGVVLLWTIFNQARGLADTPQQDIDNRIFALNCDSKQSICVGANTLTMNPGDRYLLDVKLYNNADSPMNAEAVIQLFDEDSYRTTSSVVLPVNDAKYKDKIEIILKEYPDLYIPAKSSAEFSIAIILSKEAPLGSYAIKIQVNSDILPAKFKRVNLYIE